MGDSRTASVHGVGKAGRHRSRRQRVTAPGVAIGLMLAGGAAVAQSAGETPAGIIASHVRLQGHACGKAESAQRDPQLSRPDQPVWILKCDNATYRVRMTPDMRAQVERLD